MNGNQGVSDAVTSDSGRPTATAVLEWNVLVTARQGAQRRLRRALRSLVRLQTRGFRNVFVGRVDDIEACLTAVAELRARRPTLDALLGKILPIERTYAVDAARFDEQLRAETTPLIDRLIGCSFHVRVERRGHKGVIHTHASEQALGAHLYAALEARGQRPVVEFGNPDAVVVVEVVGDSGGVGLVTRELRERFPFVKID